MKKITYLIALSVALLLSSCATVKNITYFQDKLVDAPEKIDEHAGIVIQPKDMLSIIVSCRNPELAPMFNLNQVTYMSGSEITGTSGYQKTLGYVVDNDGYIEFPVLGKLEVKNMTRWKLADMIKSKLERGGYLTDAVVTVEFMNFKVSVIGEVNAPGTYDIQGDKVTILEAISRARDLTIFGKRENISVIREIEGHRTIYQVNLCSVDLFKSPAYYLQQNDIVYVEPSEIKARQSTTDDKSLRLSSILISSGSLLASIASLVVSVLAANGTL